MRWLTALALLLGLSCGGPPQREVPTTWEFDPLSLGDELTPQELMELLKRAEERAPAEPSPVDTTRREGTQEVPGWRVQIFATTDYERASLVKEEAESLFGLPVYLKFEAPYYKVRVGDCRTRTEAEALRREAIRLGYTSAFPVRASVKVSPTEGR